jgi:hypothetical protein
MQKNQKLQICEDRCILTSYKHALSKNLRDGVRQLSIVSCQVDLSLVLSQVRYYSNIIENPMTFCPYFVRFGEATNRSG